MNASILTFYKVLNYGAVLQAYALRQTVRGLGHECAFVPVQPRELTAPYNSIRVLSLRKWSYLARLYRNRFLRAPFAGFMSRHLPDTPGTVDPETFCRTTPGADVVLVGSDQVWNRKLTGTSDAFFLPYPKGRTRKVAYAASSGGDVSFLSDPSIVAHLRDFDALSVREPSLAESVRAAGIPCETVLDPTLLLQDYSPLIRENRFGDYVGLYHVIDSPLLSRGIAQVRKATGLPVINFGPKYLPGADRNLLGVSPEDWVSMVHHSSFFYTNSFHGVAFALNFSKRFCYVPNGVASDSRSLDILRAVGSLDRVGRSEQQVARICGLPEVDVSGRLGSLRSDSLEFLRGSLT